MHPTGPYQTSLAWELRKAMTEYDMQPSKKAERIGRTVATLQD